MKKLFVANRAEIACRIAQTAHRMGLETCGVYTPADSHSRHVRVLGEVVQLPPGELGVNYMNPELLIRTARNFGADALHPGYGFLSENPDFAEKVQAAGIVWVGPPASAMRALGDKVRAKEVAAKAGVPVAPWLQLSAQPDEAQLQQIAAQIGLPLLVKAARGGGGRGQRVVRAKDEFAEALRAARLEAQRSFGSSDVFAERFLERPRHIEVQILGDQHRNLIALGERDCTLQRRNQKLIEEAPATILHPATRQSILDAAKSLAKAVGYANAGTIEFLAQQNSSGSWEFYFMELNARLQVEHPVTEMIWGIDLVEYQLWIAGGENMAVEFARLPAAPSGHAIELRLCAEDPGQDFLPTPGPLVQFSVPAEDGLRLDTGFTAGDVVPQDYDSMFAKLIFHGENRDAAIQGLVHALDHSLISGVITNKFFLRSVLSHPEFHQNRLYTRWFADHPELVGKADQLDDDLRIWARRFSSELFVRRQVVNLEGQESGGRILAAFIPAEGHGDATPNGMTKVAGTFILDTKERIPASGWITRFEICLSLEREVYGVGQRRLMFAGLQDAEESKSHHGPITAQVPGVVLDVRASVDQVVQPRVPILVIEAMKIEMPMTLPVAARITAINVKRGDRILPGQTLVTWEPAA